MRRTPKYSLRFPTWICTLGGAILIGGGTGIAQAGTFQNAGEAAGYLVAPTLMGAGIGWILSKMQGVDPKYQKTPRKEDTP